jgi:hypothetical protein
VLEAVIRDPGEQTGIGVRLRRQNTGGDKAADGSRQRGTAMQKRFPQGSFPQFQTKTPPLTVS